VLPFYLLHEPVIVTFAWIIVRWHAPIVVKYSALVAVSSTATLVIYELAVRRYRPARLLFGMKPASARVGALDDEGGVDLAALRHLPLRGCWQHSQL
jgi:peptidoglycan/LPS O-acetylase OafA/YrhL